MSVEFNHTIVWSRDSKASATFLAHLRNGARFRSSPRPPWGPLAALVPMLASWCASSTRSVSRSKPSQNVVSKVKPKMRTADAQEHAAAIGRARAEPTLTAHKQIPSGSSSAAELIN